MDPGPERASSGQRLASPNVLFQQPGEIVEVHRLDQMGVES